MSWRGFPMFFLCFDLLVPTVFSAGHVLRYIYTGISGGTDHPEFMAMGLVDDIHIYYYDSERRQIIPRPEWVERIPDPEYWEEQTQILRWEHKKFHTLMEDVMRETDRLKGPHTLQTTHGCELREDGTFRVFHELNFDGEDVISFSTETLSRTTATTAAELMKQKWYANTDCKEHWKEHLQHSCIDRLKKFIEHGKSTLEKKASPVVKVWGRTSTAGITTLSCFITGFYPQDIDVKWERDDNMKLKPEGFSGILPNEDGTYQLTKWVQVDPNDGHTYSCLVKHSSMEQGSETTWKEEDGDLGSIFWIFLGIIIGCFSICFMMTVAQGL